MPDLFKAGDPAPAFATADTAGRVWTNADFKGNTLILWFFPKADTPGCTAEGCAFRDLKGAFEAKNAAILGVSFDAATDNGAFIAKFAFNFPLLCDTNRAMGLAFGACDTATDEYARRIAVIIGADGKILHWWPKVSAKDFPNQALALV